MPVQTRSSTARAAAAAAAATTVPSRSSLSVSSVPFIPSQQPGQSTIEHHRQSALIHREANRYVSRNSDELPRSRVIVRELTLEEISRILETSLSSLYSREINNNDVYNVLSANQLLYLRNDTILSYYYYRRLEFNYTVDIPDKINELINMINIDKDNITDNNRLDITYYYQIEEMIKEIVRDQLIVNNSTTAKRDALRELSFKISNEKMILNEIIRTLYINIDSIDGEIEREIIRIDETRERIARKTNYENLKRVLEERLDKLNKIRVEQLKELISLPIYQTYRKKLIKLVNSALLLVKTFKYLIVNIGILRDVRDSDLKSIIIDDMIEALEYYIITINIVNNIIISDATNEIVYRENGYNTALKLQIDFFDDIKNIIDRRSIDDYKDDVINYIRTQGIDIPIITRQQVAADERVSRIITDITNRNSINDRREELRRDRERQILLRRQLREARITANRQAIERRREEIRVRREERRNRPTRSQPVRNIRNDTRLNDIINVRNSSSNELTRFNDNDYKEDEELKNKLEISLRGIDASYSTFFNNIKKEFIEKLTLKIKDTTVAKNRLAENRAKILAKYKLAFNTDEPNMRIAVPSIKNYVGNSVISLFIRFMKYDKNDLKFNDTARYYVVNFSLIKNPDNRFTENRQNGIDAGGLRRDFITSLMNELFEKKIFINIEGTNKYFLNPLFEPDEYMRYIINNDYLTSRESGYFDNKFIEDFYEFLAVLIRFILLNDCGLEKYLSSYIISSICSNKTEFDDNDYLSFMLNDFPSDFEMFINLMKTPEQIEYTGIAYNDKYLLDESSGEGDEINRENITEYLIKTARFMMTTTILRKDIEIKSPREDPERYKIVFQKGRKITSIFIEHFTKDLKEYFVNKNFKPVVINSYIKTPDMSDEIIKKLIENLKRTMRRQNPNNEPRLTKLTELFIEYVLKNKNGKDEDIYHKFITNLLQFWSGSSLYKENENYKLVINVNLGEDHLPQSHTCFFLIDLPNYIGNDPIGRNDEEIGNKLLNKIEIAISNVESGIGMAGGNKRLRRTRKLL